jgi:hypothetical protein
MARGKLGLLPMETTRRGGGAFISRRGVSGRGHPHLDVATAGGASHTSTWRRRVWPPTPRRASAAADAASRTLMLTWDGGGKPKNVWDGLRRDGDTQPNASVHRRMAALLPGGCARTARRPPT